MRVAMRALEFYVTISASALRRSVFV